jgi:thioredoxin-like negative regulator of GroEL
LTDERLLLVFFWHERSGPARRMDSLIAHIARKERQRLRVTRVDMERRADLARRCGIDTAPALVLVRDRHVVARMKGRASAPRIEEMLEPHLEGAPGLNPTRTRDRTPVG